VKNNFCVTFHAELLDVAPVWAAVRRALDDFGRAGVRCTFFVHPAHALAGGADLSPRLREIAQRGHEIGQHTHYYGIYRIARDGSVQKKTSLDPTVVDRCLQRDHDYLRACGFTPRGFVSGGWAMSPQVLVRLEKLGFVYDCSDRTFSLGYDNPWAPPALSDGASFAKGRLLEIPTHGPISWPWVLAPKGGPRALVCYMHDDDLLRWTRRQALAFLTRRAARGGWSWPTVGEVAGHLARPAALEGTTA